MSTSIQQQIFYPHPAAEVWEYLTQPALLSQWLMPNNFQLAVGHEFQFTAKPMPQFNSDGIFHCRVTEIVPFKKLSYSWKTGPGNGDISLDTLVVWTLVEEANGTSLHLEHTGFHETKNLGIYEGMTNGWAKKLQQIADSLNTATHGANNS